MRPREAFTLTEFLVFIPIAGLLGLSLVASLDDSQQKLQASQCLNNMRQWGLAIGMYCNDYRDYLPYEGQQGWPIDAGYNPVAWYNILSPYLKQPRLMDLYAQNRIPVPGSKSVYICPSVKQMDPVIPNPPTLWKPYFGYAMNRVLNGLSGNLRKRSIAALPGQVILLSESENNDYPFTDGFYLGTHGVEPQNVPRHAGGDNFVFVDGHAQWYKQIDYSRTSAESVNGTGSKAEWAHQPPYPIYWWAYSGLKKQ
jgi:prepilin-type processing-associated H-X9-DG protein